MSDITVSDSAFARLVESYRSEHSMAPQTPSQLMSFIKLSSQDEDAEVPLDTSYASMKEAFTRHEAASRSTPSSPVAVVPTPGFDWPELWRKYDDVFGHPPTKPAHLWNFARDEGVIVKYKYARHAFEHMQEVGKVEHVAEADVAAAPVQTEDKARSLSEEDFAALFRGYRSQYGVPPRDAKQLFSYAETEAGVPARYGAIRKGFSTWGEILRAEHVTGAPTARGESPPTDESAGDEHSPAPEETGLEGAPGGAAGSARTDRAASPARKSRHWDRDTFLAVMAAFGEDHGGRPRDAKMLMEYANLHGHAVRYGAANRAWRQWSDAE